VTERELDQRLSTGMTALHNALNGVLDIDAGLADAQLPALQKTLVQDLDDVLDLEAGLDRILPTTALSSPPTAESPPETHNTTLSTFADDLTSRPLQERLAARVWFPIRELTALEALTHLVFRVRGLIVIQSHAVDRTRDVTRDIFQARKLAQHLTGDLDTDLDTVSMNARDLNRATTHSTRNSCGAMLLMSLVSARDRARAATRAHVYIHRREVTLARELIRALDDETVFDKVRIGAVDRLLKAVTDVTGDDLTQVDLHGIPLEGLRWSGGQAGTRWPTEWEDQIRRSSVEISPGLYEIRYGGINADTQV
jgi:hypothetical protein